MRVEQKKRIHTKNKQTATLYAIVFESYTVKVAVFSLLGFLLIQPVAPLYAATEEVDAVQLEEHTINSDPVLVVEEVTEVVIETSAEEVAIVPQDEVLPEESATAVESTIKHAEAGLATSTEIETDVLQAPQTDGEVSADNGSSVDSQLVDGQASSTYLVEETPATSTPVETTEEAVAPDSLLDINEVQVPVEATTTKIASTSDQLINVHNTSAFAFDTTECAVVGDGAYYCSNKKADLESFEDGVFAAPDSDGDMEIYIRVLGELMQITHNTVDDSAPYYDAVSNRIVWHSVVDDRYQVMSYDIALAEMIRLTTASYNNMEPVAYGSITLWQAWIDGNWEIMQFDGQTLKQLTNNTLHDVSPHMREGYVVWQTQFEDGWKVAVYNEETKVVEYIASEGGLKVENPRFVLVYDSTDAQGDRKTIGYDFDSKSSFSLGILPQELPEELPEPDQTGETRALIQNKLTARDGEQEVIDVEAHTASSGTTTLNSFYTLDLSGGVIVSTSAAQVGTIEDIVIPNFTSISTSSQDTFSAMDIVIPPFTASTNVE